MQVLCSFIKLIMEKNLKLRFDTICAKENIEITTGSPHVLPIHATSAFSYKRIEDSIDVFTGQNEGFVYSRYGNPTISSVQDKLAQLESIDLEQDAYCVLTSSGLSAISTLTISLLKPGDKVLTQGDLYGGTTEIFVSILEKYGIEIIFTDLNDLKEVEILISKDDSIKMMYFESPSNPTLKCIDLSQLSKIAQSKNILTAIDNTFATCYLQRPLNLGIDFVIYSTTKFLNGHGNGIAGAIITTDTSYQKEIWKTMKLMGTNCNPFDAWLVHNGLKTLTLRMDKHSANALALAQFLNDHPKVKKVNYPGLHDFEYHTIAKKQMSQFGGMMSFELDGTIEDAKNFMNNTKLCSITSTLGNVDTLLLHPATSSHLNVSKEIREKAGITDGLIRMSVGIENIEDLKIDVLEGIG